MKEKEISKQALKSSYDRLDGLERANDVAALVRELRSPLRHRMLTIRGSAARRLGRLRANAAAPAIVALLDDADTRVRELAIVALGRIGACGESIRRQLRSIAETAPEDNTRALAIAALGEIGDRTIVPRLPTLLSSRSGLVRGAALYAALILGGPDAEDAIAPYTSDWRGRRRRRRVQAVVDQFRREYRGARHLAGGHKPANHRDDADKNGGE